MSKIKSKDTKLEVNFKKVIKGLKFRYQPKIFGKPDFASRKLKIAIFVDSCFWHHCPRHFRKPSSNISYWEKKIKSNVKRTKEVDKFLKKHGWIVLHFWEHDINKNARKCLDKIKLAINSRR